MATSKQRDVVLVDKLKRQLLVRELSKQSPSFDPKADPFERYEEGVRAAIRMISELRHEAAT